jgi:hypothetical protein
MLAEILKPGECVVTDDEEAGQDKEDGECCLLSSAGVSVATCPWPSAASNRQLSFQSLTIRVVHRESGQASVNCRKGVKGCGCR